MSSTYLVTGASRGIGQGLATGVPQPGDTVWLVSRSRPALLERSDGVTRHCRTHGHHTPHPFDTRHLRQRDLQVRSILDVPEHQFFTRDVLEVAGVDRCCLDVHDHIVRAENGFRHVEQLEHGQRRAKSRMLQQFQWLDLLSRRRPRILQSTQIHRLAPKAAPLLRRDHMGGFALRRRAAPV